MGVCLVYVFEYRFDDLPLLFVLFASNTIPIDVVQGAVWQALSTA